MIGFEELFIGSFFHIYVGWISIKTCTNTPQQRHDNTRYTKVIRVVVVVIVLVTAVCENYYQDSGSFTKKPRQNKPKQSNPLAQG